MSFINIEEWKDPKYLDDNTFNIIEETLLAFRDYEINNSSILPATYINEIKHQEFIFYQLVKEKIALESYRFSLYAADVIVYFNMLMKEGIESNDLLEVLQSLFTDAKTRLDFVENLNNKYNNNAEMDRILNSICEYERSLRKRSKPDRCCGLISYILSILNSNQSNQPLLSNENNENKDAFQDLMSKHKKGLNIICEIKKFWEDQIVTISKFIDIFEKDEGSKGIRLSQKNGRVICNKWEEEKKCGENFYHKIRNLLN